MQASLCNSITTPFIPTIILQSSLAACFPPLTHTRKSCCNLRTRVTPEMNSKHFGANQKVKTIHTLGPSSQLCYDSIMCMHGVPTAAVLQLYGQPGIPPASRTQWPSPAKWKCRPTSYIHIFPLSHQLSYPSWGDIPNLFCLVRVGNPLF